MEFTVQGAKRQYNRHGMTGHPLWRTWVSMKQRCNNPNNTHYEYYGGRGITVCERWSNFALFVEDMGERPSKNHTVDRIDNNLGYSPQNCRWATRSEQLFNTRIRSDNKAGIRGVSWDKQRGKWSVKLTIDGKRKTLGMFETIEECKRLLESRAHANSI